MTRRNLKKQPKGYAVHVLNKYYDRFEHEWIEQWIPRTKLIDLEMAEALTGDLTVMKCTWKIVDQDGKVVQES